ncbi:uncharacterized protein [Rutidosis leptorrhynchoides]|uniref:uncharacterized protein n=1 Tax=Rutidosis leptorrhynchoides TaxID=125765 RepID=UPI003A9A3E72
MKSMRVKSRVESICNEQGDRFYGHDVASQIVNHFKQFLGEARDVQPMDNLGDIFTKSLSFEEANAMVVEMTDSEIKKAIFDIDSDKASGPDGFTAGEVNATLLALIPKVDTPNKVSDFRPIACCNVLYKGISKIIIERIKNGLHKVVSLNQSAFVPGRSIQDNILLTQELLRGYGRAIGPKRCAMKIDIQKAYDKVSWSFLRDILVKFGFLEKNDDLLVLCKGEVKSVAVVKKVLDEFSDVSGLFPNLQKSTIFFSSIHQGIRNDILNVLPFSVGKLPMRYLGVPLLAKRLGVGDCKILVDKVREKTKGQNCKGSAKVAWKLICRPKKQGGLGLRPLNEWNDVLLMKQVWKILSKKESIWWQWINRVKLKGKDYWDINHESSDSWGWRKMLVLRDVMKPHIFKDSNGDMWWITNDNKLKAYSTNQAWKDLGCSDPKIDWYHVVWYPQITPKHAFISWLVVQNRLSTQDRLKKWYPNEQFECSFCGNQEDSHSHLFFRCDFTSQVWNKVKRMLVYKGLNNGLLHIVQDMAKYTAIKDIRNILNKVAIGVVVYYIWMERNRRIFRKVKKSVNEVSDDVKDFIRVKMTSLKVKDTKNVQKVAELCSLVLMDNNLQIAV